MEASKAKIESWESVQIWQITQDDRNMVEEKKYEENYEFLPARKGQVIAHHLKMSPKI